MLSKKPLLPLRNTGLALHKLTSRAPRQKLFVEEGFSNYTVVSAVYNVGKYLHDFFTSIVNQTLSFENNIYLIMVDDGSTDDSAAIIKRWQKKFPDNILYLHKENGGQASARNMGLPHVMTEWVTFIDPDDFLDHNYFLEVDRCIERNSTKDVQMVCCNLIFYYEDKNTYSDTHPLNYRFKEKETILDVSDMKKYMCFSVNTNFFSLQAVRKNNVQFDCSIKPDSEDMNFIALFITAIKKGNALFIKNAFYFYRKRQDQSSTLDSSWKSKGKFLGVLQSYLRYAELYKKAYKSLPYYAQRSLLYQLIWYINRIVNNPETICHLSKEEKKEFEKLFFSCFQDISQKVINEFDIAGVWFYHKIGILSLFKKIIPSFTVVYIDQIDLIKSEIHLKYFTPSINIETFTLNGQKVIPTHTKNRKFDFIGHTFIIEREIWLPIYEHCDNTFLNIEIDTLKVKLICNKKWFSNSYITVQEIKKLFFIPHKRITKINKYTNSWIFIDRDIQADDNAEHLYRYIKNNTNKKIFFILRQSSHDWERLKNEGFHLIPFGSDEHKKALMYSKNIISSHIDLYIYNFFKNNFYKDKNIIFLQHGITKDDLSRWLNGKQINLFLTATTDEYKSIVKDNSRYKFTNKEVFLGGFPRHDNLLALTKKHKSHKNILIMPTWRNYLSGEKTYGSKMNKNAHFMESDYAKSWKSILNNSYLKYLTDKYNYNIIFFPHNNIQYYLNNFYLSSHIKIRTHKDTNIQKLFVESSLLITDYSSVAFEMAFLKKPILYYQFDKEDFFKEHTYQAGYFDYEKNGFGPIVYTEKAFFIELEKILQRDCKLQSPYMERINSTFNFQDNNNCKRVYNAICRLENKEYSLFSSINILYEFSVKATEAKKYNDAIDYWKSFYDLTTKEVQGPVYLWIGRMFLDQGKYVSFQKIYNYCYSMYSQTKIPEILYAEYNVINRNYTEAISVYKTWDTNDFDVRSLFFYARALAEKKETVSLENFYTEHKELIESIEDYVILFQVYLEMSQCNWNQVILILEENIKKFTYYILKALEPEIILFKAYLRQKNIDIALKYKNIFKNNSLLNREIIYMLIKSKTKISAKIK